jgi:Flp pilus assembly protein TadG
MTRHPARPSRLSRRTGATVVEFAVVVPILLMLIAGIIEFGRTIMVEQIMTNASREGTRKATLPGATASDVKAVVKNYGSAAGITVNDDEIVITPTDPSSAATGDQVSVEIKLAYSRVSWLPTTWFLSSTAQLRAKATMRKEYDDR